MFATNGITAIIQVDTISERRGHVCGFYLSFDVYFFRTHVSMTIIKPAIVCGRAGAYSRDRVASIHSSLGYLLDE